MIYRADCKHFIGDRPCVPHKESGVHCAGCLRFEARGKRILIVKLEAMGDVLRTTPIIPRLRQEFPDCRITWVTRHAEMLPAGDIDEIVRPEAEGLLRMCQSSFDIAINLDKDSTAAALLSAVPCADKRGFIMKDGVVQPCDDRALPKYLCGLFDDVSKANHKSYQQEIFEICGFDYRGEPYLVDRASLPVRDWSLPRHGVVGLNTGAGGRWPTRLWSDGAWISLAGLLLRQGLTPLLLGGAGEHARNVSIAQSSGALYLGCMQIPEFMALVDRCDVVVTQVTMALHVALAFEKRVVLLNNVFNPREFDLRGRGVIVEPRGGCDCYYGSSCKHAVCCMANISPDTVADAVARLMAGEAR